jgi:hypothetical protein
MQQLNFEIAIVIGSIIMSQNLILAFIFDALENFLNIDS